MALLTAMIRFLKLYSRTFSYFRVLRKLKKQNMLTGEVASQLQIEWGNEVINLAGIEVSLKGVAPSKEPVLFVGNHMSYLDIPVLLSQVPSVFLAKKELESWPILGPACKLVGILFVKRNSEKSRKEAAEAVADCIHRQKRSITVFPAGTTTIDERLAWRFGTFRIAHEYGIPVQPFRVSYTPTRKVAYIDKDVFAIHAVKLLAMKKIKVELEFFEPIRVEKPEEDCKKLWQQSRESLQEALTDLPPPNPTERVRTV